MLEVGISQITAATSYPPPDRTCTLQPTCEVHAYAGPTVLTQKAGAVTRADALQYVATAAFRRCGGNIPRSVAAAKSGDARARAWLAAYRVGKPQVEAPTPLVWTPHHAVPDVTCRLPVFPMPAHVATSVRCGSLDRDSMYSTPMLPKALSSPAGLEQTTGRRWSPA